MTEPEWYRANRANWDERVGVHIGSGGYDLSDLRAGRGRLNAIEEAELPSVEGKRLAHLQCHFGADSLALAQRGAEVVGLDFSAPAIEAARKLADELGLANRARFVHADLYEALAAIPPPHEFDMVFVTWGAICWLRSPDGTPGLFAPYFSREPVVDTEGSDYVDPDARLGNATIYNWIHPLGDVVTSLIASGMSLEWLHEHDAVPWRMFKILVKDASGLYRWPDRPWLPLAFSLSAIRG